ncbi:MAG: DNA topoisomerase 3 [Bacteroidia bacterium]
MKLCIAEKPSVAKEIANVLGAKTRKDGYFEGNGFFVSWTFGHLCTLKEPHDYNEQWKWWNLNTLPMLPQKYGIKLIQNDGVEKQFNTIKTLVEKCDEVINCGDAGQEGELIQRWVLSLAGNRKPIKRLWISSLTEEAIKEGFKKLRNGSEFDKLYAAGSSRAIGDWLLGMNATRLYTLKFGKEKQVLSIGRVQTPTLALIVQRQKEIQNFKAETYWEVKTLYRDVLFSSDAGKIVAKEKAQELTNSILNHPFEITSFQQKEGKEHPPRLFDLTAIQVECNRNFGFTAEQTLNIVQKLYEQKLVTYPRVDTTYLSDDIYKKVPSILKGLKGFSSLVNPILSEGKIRKSKKVFDNSKVTDHHAIIPTGVTATLGGVEKQVYDTITTRFISVFYPDCTVSNTTVEGKVGDVKFKATGRQVLKLGWREVYGTVKVDDSEEQSMPIFKKGEKGPHTPEIQEKQTTPPKYYTEATLLRAMETAGKQVDDDELRELMKDNGIGRPSTRANIIETLFRRKYIKKEKKRIEATEVGIKLIDSIDNELLKSAELTGIWEKKLRDIEKGKFEVEQFKKELIEMVSNLVREVKNRKTLLKIGAKPDPIICPICGKGEILTGKKAWGCSEWKNGCDFLIPFELGDKKISFELFNQLLVDKKLIKASYKSQQKLLNLVQKKKEKATS